MSHYWHWLSCNRCACVPGLIHPTSSTSTCGYPCNIATSFCSFLCGEQELPEKITENLTKQSVLRDGVRMDCGSLPHNSTCTISTCPFFSFVCSPPLKSQRLEPECQRTWLPDMFRGSCGKNYCLSLYSPPDISFPITQSTLQLDKGTNFCNGRKGEGGDNEGLF